MASTIAAHLDQVPVTASIKVHPPVCQGFAGRLLANIARGPLPRLDSVLALASCLRLGAGELLVEHDQPFPFLVLVERGLLAQAVTQEGRVTTVAFLAKGDVTGNLFALYGELTRDPRGGFRDAWAEAPYRISAVSDVRVVLLDAPLICSLASRYAEWASLRSRLLVEHSLRQTEREAERLTTSVDERYNRLVERSPEAVAQLTQREIARYLGISEVTMSRLMARRGGRRSRPAEYGPA